MKIRVYITTKEAVLNPADVTIKSALHQMGYTSVESLRLGRYLEFEVDSSLSEAEWRERISMAFKNPLANFPNPVTEEWKMEVVP